MLLEREPELTGIGDALAAAQEGRGRVVLVEAAAGLGKTSLLRAACDAAATMGFACLRARASELERDFAYGCVRQLLEPVVANAAEPERQRLFDGAASLSEPLFGPPRHLRRARRIRRFRCCTGSTGCSTISPRRGPSRCPSTTCTGRIRHRCDSRPISGLAWTASASWSSRPRGRVRRHRRAGSARGRPRDRGDPTRTAE
jgi:hypothetical protein